MHNAGLQGKAFTNHIQKCRDPSIVFKLLKAYRLSAAKIKGTPESFKALRSRAGASMDAHGPFTAMVNLNPLEVQSQHVMEMCGHPYGFDGFGRPDDGRPDGATRFRLVGNNPVACAVYFRAYMEAFQKVFVGWPIGAPKQQNSDCLFGKVWQHEWCEC